MKLIEWLRERHQNALQISHQKVGDDKVGWLEDAGYFNEAINQILMSDAAIKHAAEEVAGEFGIAEEFEIRIEEIIRCAARKD